MATVQAALALYDGMTQPLMSIHRALNIVLNTFQAMQTASSRSIDVSAIQEAREELARAGAAMNQIESNVSRGVVEQQSFNRQIRDGTSAAGGLLQKLKGVAAVYLGITGLRQLVDTSDKLASTKARLELIVDDGGSVSELEQKIMASAQRSRASYFDTANAIASMGANASSAFSGNDELIAFMEQINKQFVIGGASAQGQSAAMLQLTQAMGAGALRGEELNSILENAPGIARAIEQYMGIAEGSIKKYAEQGLITADVVKNAMFAVADETNARFESMPKTWGQIWASMKNDALVIFSPILEKINQLFNSDQFSRVVSVMLRGLALIAGAAGAAFSTVIGVAYMVVDCWDMIAPVALGAAAAVGVYMGATKGAALATKALALAQTVGGTIIAAYHGFLDMLSLGYGVLTGRAGAASAATLFFNSALMASPITWVILGIIALVTVLYGAVAVVNHFAGTSVSATGIIGAAFAILFTFIANNFVIPLTNTLFAIGNFLGNVFQNPVAAVKVLFYDMALTVIGYIANMAHAIEDVINKIPGVQVDITAGLDGFYNKIKDAQQKVKDESGWVEYFKRIDYVDYSKTAGYGYDLGAALASKVSGLINPAAKEDGFDAYGLGDRINGIYDNVADTAANTAAAADSLEFAEEDLRFMRDIAEREAVNRFTTAEIVVNMGGITNNVKNNNDLDGIVERVLAGTREAIEIGVEGVHI